MELHYANWYLVSFEVEAKELKAFKAKPGLPGFLTCKKGPNGFILLSIMDLVEKVGVFAIMTLAELFEHEDHLAIEDNTLPRRYEPAN